MSATTNAMPSGSGSAADEMGIIEWMPRCLERQREAFRASPYPDAASRRDALERLRRAVSAYQGELAEAISRDFGGRSRFETMTVDIVPTLMGIRHAKRHAGRWMRSRRRSLHPIMQPAGARIVYQPLGVVGIMVPWNYPVLLALAPLTGALAAGNRAMMKLSEFTPESNAVLRKLLAEAFSADEVAVVLGDVPVSQAFASLPFDHLIFTGSTTVGRRVMAAAAENLTPVTLELGGKSPVIVDEDAPLGPTVERLLFGKLVNAGQTCIAPDYVLCTPARREALVAGIQGALPRLYPRLRENTDYASIINEAQYARLQGLLEDARERGAQVLPLNPGGDDLQGTRKLAPHLVLEAPAQARVLREELFGPILPIVTVPDLEAALAYVQARPRPLALYYFGQERARQQRVLTHSHAGGVCINDTMLHVAQEELPFGGVGESGMGHYHGHHGFLTFSHQKAVFTRGRVNPTRLLYPPYGGVVQRLIQWFMAR
ncbi:coniferyl aldehyde dehydrogenase [Aquisalimonas sp.]|uniref:coniferyl aldehyde dehydrogenase n=1 Tax=Aquisalimonas sp. TaxID=1872621 RepID=UPI0025BD6305|nr:coniferyl aldehyde dehydrogenase [Aquisalimonas sp.]